MADTIERSDIKSSSGDFSLLVIEDHRLLAEMLRGELSRTEAFRVEVAFSAAEAERMVSENGRFDVILLDYLLPGSMDLEVFERLNDLNDGGVALFSGVADDNVIDRAISLGAAGFIPKSLDLATLRLAIQIICKGGVFFPRDRFGSFFARRSQPKPLKEIELKILHLVMEGLQNKEIANRISISEVTVKMHLRAIFRKLSAKNRTEAALKARALGLYLI